MNICPPPAISDACCDLGSSSAQPNSPMIALYCPGSRASLICAPFFSYPHMNLSNTLHFHNVPALPPSFWLKPRTGLAIIKMRTNSIRPLNLVIFSPIPYERVVGDVVNVCGCKVGNMPRIGYLAPSAACREGGGLYYEDFPMTSKRCFPSRRLLVSLSF